MLCLNHIWVSAGLYFLRLPVILGPELVYVMWILTIQLERKIYEFKMVIKHLKKDHVTNEVVCRS